MIETVAQAREKIVSLGDPVRAAGAQRYFKTAPGEYGEGDVFAGVSVPSLRKLARECRALSLADAVRLLHDPVHEVRFVALLLMVQKFEEGDAAQQERVYARYLKNTRFINNWDLVDVSAERIVGPYLRERDKAPLETLARSPLLWERRIAVLSTFHMIRHRAYSDTLRVAERLLDDTEDLIHKAVGWMLREVGKRDRHVLEAFLRNHAGKMPRTMLRYAVERFPEPLRLRYLRGERARRPLPLSTPQPRPDGPAEARSARSRAR